MGYWIMPGLLNKIKGESMKGMGDNTEKKEECTAVVTHKGTDWWNNKHGGVKKEGWKTGAKEEKVTCSLVKSIGIYLDLTPRQKIQLLMDKYQYKEWIGYLVGEFYDNGDLYVSDVVIPPHEEASGASATAEPHHHPEKCVGIIHSHNSMGAFHSGTDHEYVDGNYPVSITVAKKANSPLEWDADMVTETPCGKKVRFDCQVYYLAPEPSFDTEKWLEEACKNVEKGTKTAQFYQYPYKYANYGNGVQQTKSKSVKELLEEKEENEYIDMLAQMGYGHHFV